MAKTQAIRTRGAASLAVGGIITFEQARDAIQQLNWTFGRRPHLHFAATCGPADWFTTGTVHTLQATFPSSVTGYQLRLRTRIKVPVDVVNIICGVRTYFPSGTGNVRVTVGAANTVFSCSSANNGTEQRATLATASTGTGWLTATVEVSRLTGSALSYLYNCRVQDEAITSSLPDPQND